LLGKPIPEGRAKLRAFDQQQIKETDTRIEKHGNRLLDDLRRVSDRTRLREASHDIKLPCMDEILDLMRSVPDSPQGLLEFVTNLLLAYGYLVIFLGSALDNFGLPSSGDIVMFAGGFFANSGRAALPLVMLIGFLGASVSDNSVYWIGRIGGRPILTRILKVRLLTFILDAKSLGKVERYFEEHGRKMVLVGRFGPGLRSMTPLFAGVSRMKYRYFLPYDLAATTTWALLTGTVGYVFGEYWNELLAVARSIGYSFVALVALLIIIYVLRRARRKRAARERE
jgi:membrane-associated protein